MNRRYEKTLDKDGNLTKLRQFKTVWRTVPNDYFEYNNFLEECERDGLNPDDYITVVTIPEPTVLTLEELKLQKLSTVKFNYNESRNTTSSVTTDVLDSNGIKIVVNSKASSKEDFQTMIDNWEYLIGTGERTLTEKRMIKDYDNEYHQVGLEDVKLFVIAIKLQGEKEFYDKETLMIDISNATTITELNAIEI